MLKLTIALHILAIAAQLGAIWLAFYQFERVGRHRWSWSVFCMMLSAMLLQHVPPLEWAMNTGLFDIKGALVGLLAALLALVGVAGLRRLLIDFEKMRQEMGGRT